MRRSIRKLKNRCTKCGGIYTYEQYKWCKACEIKQLEDNFKNWTSENDKIDNLIQKVQLRINDPNDIMFEWVPFNQFKIKEVGKDGSATVYLAKWKDGPLHWDKNKYIRESDKTVVLKCLSVAQQANLSDEVIIFTNLY
jgi:hypothetical protein